jgi:hypothetical protein
MTLCLLLVAMTLAGIAHALTIRVAPRVLVLSSEGGRLTVHTDVPYADANDVLLAVNGINTEVVTFADDRGNLVAQCDKHDIEEAVGDFDGKWTTAIVTLNVNDESASETLSIKK